MLKWSARQRLTFAYFYEFCHSLVFFCSENSSFCDILYNADNFDMRIEDLCYGVTRNAILICFVFGSSQSHWSTELPLLVVIGVGDGIRVIFFFLVCVLIHDKMG